MSDLHICSCGHQAVGHINGGPCMRADCNCALLDDSIGTAEQAARRLYGDAYYEAEKARADKLRELQLSQAVWTTSQLMNCADLREAQVRLLVLAWWLLAADVPVVLAAVCWAVIA